MLQEQNSLWCQILNEKYSGPLHQKDSPWWKDLNSVCFGAECGRWFNEGICRRVGDGRDIAFWEEDWTGSGSFKSIFPRLFLLSSQKEASILEMGRWVGAAWVWDFKWERVLLDRELQRVVELERKTGGFSPKLGQRDKWVWVKDESGVYSVKSAYALIHDDSVAEDSWVFNKLWKAKAPSGLIALAWRVLIDRVQTRYDLSKRNALPVNVTTTCVLCAFDVENSFHLFFNCYVSWRVWSKLLDWLGIQFVLPSCAVNHFSQFCGVLRGGKKVSQALILIWIAAVHSIWQCRNGLIFRGDSVEIGSLVDLVQYKVWLWLSSHERSFSASVFEWISNPAICIFSLS